jgi:hypothetical protein
MPKQEVTLMALAETTLARAKSDHPGDRFIGVAADRGAGAIILLRGNLQPLVVPITWFRRVKGFPAPDPTEPEIID